MPPSPNDDINGMKAQGIHYSQKHMPMDLDTWKTFVAISALLPPDLRKVLHS